MADLDFGKIKLYVVTTTSGNNLLSLLLAYKQTAMLKQKKKLKELQRISWHVSLPMLLNQKQATSRKKNAYKIELEEIVPSSLNTHLSTSKQNANLVKTF